MCNCPSQRLDKSYFMKTFSFYHIRPFAVHPSIRSSVHPSVYLDVCVCVLDTECKAYTPSILPLKYIPCCVCSPWHLHRGQFLSEFYPAIL